MKAVQTKNYSKNIDTLLCEIAQPKLSDSEVLIRVKAAAVNPVELLILTGSINLIQDYAASYIRQRMLWSDRKSRQKGARLPAGRFCLYSSAGGKGPS